MGACADRPILGYRKARADFKGTGILVRDRSNAHDTRGRTVIEYWTLLNEAGWLSE